jgi:hypothetical protein
VIRRLFWLILGAVLGVTGYRRLTMLVRSWSPAARAGQVSEFVADVREGMSLYRERHPRPRASGLESHTGPGGTPSASTSSPNGARFYPDDTKDGS